MKYDPFIGAAPLAAVTPKPKHAYLYLASHDCWTGHEPRHCAANGTEPCTHTHAEASR